jgi:uncharacterized repeat protein (TIGR01451 family)
MQATARAVGLMAIAAAAALVVPLVATGPANAKLIPKAELSVVKTVASHGPTIKLDPTLSDTGENGHLEWVEDGLRLSTENDPGSCVSNTPPQAITCDPAYEFPQTKIAEYVDTLTPLSEVVSAPVPFLTYRAITAPTYGPEYRLLVDIHGPNNSLDGVADLVLTRQVFGPDWSGYLGVNGPMFAVIPAPNGQPNTNVGTLAEWLAALNALPQAPAPVVTAFGFAVPKLTNGAIIMDGVIQAIDFAGAHYSLARVYQSGITAAPGETVSYRLVVANGNSVNSRAAQGVQVADVLPPEMTYVDASLAQSGAAWPCSFTNNMLSCGATTFAKGESRTIEFQATLDDDISTAGLPQSEGHWVDVQHNANESGLNVGQTRTVTALCPMDYMATDGGLLLDQAGSSADIVIESSRVTTSQGGANGWAVRATNLGYAAADITVQVTCLGVEVGSSGGHKHTVDASTLPMQQKIQASDDPSAFPSPRMITRSCPTGYTPYAPEFETTSASGVAVIRESYVVDSTWYWAVDFAPGTDASFGLSCLAPLTYAESGHTAELVITTPDDTISIPAEAQAEGIMACPADSFAIVGGYGGYSSDVWTLGAEPRGDRYMFRFYNYDSDSAQNADIQATCIGELTAHEPTYKDIINTAYVTTTTKDRNAADNSSAANVAVNGDPVAGLPSGVTMNPLTATRTQNGNGKTTALTFTMSCPKTKPCNFTVKAFSGTTLVASKTTSLAAQAANKSVTVSTTSAGKNLTFGDNITVKIKTTAGTTLYSVGVI